MISRRQMLGSGAAISALGFSYQGTAAVPSARPPTSLALVIVDERFDAAPSIARSLATSDIPRVPLSRDVLDFWHRRVAALCATGRHAIAGVTTERGFFLLRTLAADHRLRVRSHRAHGALVSWVIGPK